MSKNLERSRREFLKKSMAVAPALALGGIALDGVARDAGAASSAGAAANESAQAYHPTFFNQEEFDFITAAVDRLIPRDKYGPGALEANVPEFIDRQMQTPYAVGAKMYLQGPFQTDLGPDMGYQLPLTPQEVYRLGIAEANAFARKTHNLPFNKATAEQQDALLVLMEAGKADFEKLPSQVFFAALLQSAREGFFSDPIHGGNRRLVGWRLIGFPGARADFMDWVERNQKYPFPPVSISGERG